MADDIEDDKLRGAEVEDNEIPDDEDDWLDTQWTAEALAAYQQRAAELADQLQAHVAATGSREGRAREDAGYWQSAQRLREAMRAYTEAEARWCGSSAFHLVEWIDEDDDDDDEDEADGPGEFLSVLTRSDYRILDAHAVVTEGRAAYLRLWPSDVSDDAEVRVHDVASAFGEIVHERGWSTEADVPGLELAQDYLTCVVHDGPLDTEWEDPFAIVTGEDDDDS